MKEKNKATLFAFIAILLWGTVVAVAKLTLDNINGLQLAFYIMVFATLTALLLSLATKKIKELPELIRKHWLFIFLLGGFGIGAYQLFYLIALKHAPAAQINVLNYMWPIFILGFAAIILKEKFSWKIIASFALGLIGVIIVITEGNFVSLNKAFLGSYVLMIVGAACWAIFSVYNRKKKFPALNANLLYNFSATIILGLVMIITKTSFIIPRNEILGAAYIGIIPTGIGYLLWVKAMQNGDTAFIGNLGHLAPFLSLFFIFIILKEQILISEIIGLLVIVSGILLQVKFNKKKINKNH